MKPILGANNKAARIEITLPVDGSGEYAFDDEGNPIKGKTPITFTVPRYDCMTREQFKQLNKELAEIDERTEEDGSPLSPHERGIQTVIAMVRPFVDDATLTILEGLCLFELEQIAQLVQEGSKITVGELQASTNS